ncbi:uncharacterized protein BdWA1_003764 [Babesia duncani]|nr:hypothetical protein BdWA1_003764 [Babesia duncani]
MFDEIRTGLSFILLYRESQTKAAQTSEEARKILPIVNSIIEECDQGIAAGVKRQTAINEGVLKTWRFLGEDYHTGNELSGIFHILCDIMRGVKKAYSEIVANPAKYLATLDNDDDKQVFISKFMQKRRGLI